MAQERDDFANWCMFLLGGFLVSTSAPKLYVYIVTGSAIFRDRRLLLVLSGADAALIHALIFVGGAFLLANGMRGLRSK